MNAVKDFWTVGGSLLLFCDNDPYTFEVNYLLAFVLQFSQNGRSGFTSVQFGGLPCQGTSGTFKGWIGKEQIAVGKSETPTRQSFTPKVELPAPGKCNRRLSLRPGLVKFYEGNTISYAVSRSGQPISSESDLWPFTAFAWTSENTSPPRPFILFHDPPITSDALECRGPVVIHGGFTSAFYEFGDDKTGGTGRLIISIACWLTRIEERMYRAKISANEIVKSIPRLTGNYTVTGNFTGFRTRHSILCLDKSGSMKGYYPQLARGANEYINIQKGRGGVITVIQFDDRASIVMTAGTNTISETDCSSGGTNFTAALQCALQIIDGKVGSAGYEYRILFFTDGQASIPTAELQRLKSANIRLDAVGFGSADQSVLSQLVTCGGQVIIGRTMAEVQTIFRITAAAD
jgi:hypothetical protein